MKQNETTASHENHGFQTRKEKEQEQEQEEATHIYRQIHCQFHNPSYERRQDIENVFCTLEPTS